MPDARRSLAIAAGTTLADGPAAAFTAAATGGHAQTPPISPRPDQAPTPPPAGTAGPRTEIEGAVESVENGRITVQTPTERVIVDVSDVRDGRALARPGQRVIVVGVMGPERELMKATELRPSPGRQGVDAPVPLTVPEDESRRPGR